MTKKTRREPAGRAVLQDSVTTALSAAAVAELAGTGYARLSLDAVARRAGVGKAALYRRWKSKQDMVAAVLGTTLRREQPAFPDTGSLAGDVHEFLAYTRAELSDDTTRRILLDMVAEMARVPELATLLWQAVAPPRRQAVETMLRRAQNRGEIPADADLDLAVDLLIAPLLFRVSTRGRTALDDTHLDRLTHAAVAALAAT